MTPFYEEDGITIYHGDCREILPNIDPDLVSLVLTDPPYGIGARTTHAKERPGLVERLQTSTERRNRWEWTPKDYPAVVGDDEPFDPEPLLRFGRCVLWGANHFASRLPDEKCWLVWSKAAESQHVPDAELAWTNLGGRVQEFRHLWDGYRRQSEIGFHVHPTQKPVALMRWVLEGWTEPGHLILDPYMGSGPIAQACKEMSRGYIGIEIEERYCEIAVQRLAQGVLAFD